jgi:HEAT repeat protein/S1-C subfamily serine protease
MIRYSCPKCDTSLKSADDKAGTKTTCPRCGEKLEVPAASEDKKAAAGKATKADSEVKKNGKGKTSSGSKSTLYIAIGAGAVLVIGGAAGFLMMGGSGPPAPVIPVAPLLPPTMAPPSVAVKPAPKPTETTKAGDDSGAERAANVRPSLRKGRNPRNAGDQSVAKAPDVPKPDSADKPQPTPPIRRSTAGEEKEENAGEPRNPDRGELVRTPSLNSEQIYQRLLKSTVCVFVVEKDKPVTLASGTLIDRKLRLVLTNDHVAGRLTPGQSLLVLFPQEERGETVVTKEENFKLAVRGAGIPAWVETTDVKRDLALIKLNSVPDNTVPLSLAKKTLAPGDTAHAMGSAGASAALWVLSTGNIRGRPFRHKWSSVTQEKEAKDGAEHEGMVVEAQVPTNPGDSGGPLVNERSELIGVTHGGKLGANAMSTFIDLSEVRQFLHDYYRSKGLTPPALDQPVISREADVPSLIALLADPDAGARKRIQACNQLGQMGSDAKAAVNALVAALSDKNEVVRRAAAEGLEQIGNMTQSQIDAVTQALRDDSAEVRLASVNALKRMGEEADSAVPALRQCLRDPDARVRIQALRTLAQLGPIAAKDQATVPDISRALREDKNHDVRSEAAVALGKMGQAAVPALPALEDALKDTNRDVRVNVLSTFEALGPDAKPAISNLVAALKERDRDVRLGAISALGAMGPDARPALEKMLELMGDRDLREAVGRAFARIGKPAVKALTQALDSGNGEVRRTAIEALGEIGPDADAAFAKLFILSRRDTFPGNREALIEASKKIRPEGGLNKKSR